MKQINLLYDTEEDVRTGANKILADFDRTENDISNEAIQDMLAGNDVTDPYLRDFLKGKGNDTVKGVQNTFEAIQKFIDKQQEKERGDNND